MVPVEQPLAHCVWLSAGCSCFKRARQTKLFYACRKHTIDQSINLRKKMMLQTFALATIAAVAVGAPIKDGVVAPV